MTSLSVDDHDRGSAGLTYVYPVVSRRAGGVSVGINLNTNNACNWRCVYCQVPGLVWGDAPRCDLGLLERELRGFLQNMLQGDFMTTRVPEGARVWKDIAISGNGEPTSCADFGAVIDLVSKVLDSLGQLGKIPIVLITNGSLVHREPVLAALGRLAQAGGRVWYKLDSATDAGAAALNSNRAGHERARRNLELCARACPTWLQTMVLARDGVEPSLSEQNAYLDLIVDLVAKHVPVQGVLLYGPARASHQPEAASLSSLPEAWMRAYARAIEVRGLPVQLSL
jgi:wyosine [tRNA(Phe)-imidazoG37] synthetase (radical SAM superfamily)